MLFEFSARGCFFHITPFKVTNVAKVQNAYFSAHSAFHARFLQRTSTAQLHFCSEASCIGLLPEREHFFPRKNRSTSLYLGVSVLYTTFLPAD